MKNSAEVMYSSLQRCFTEYCQTQKLRRSKQRISIFTVMPKSEKCPKFSKIC